MIIHFYNFNDLLLWLLFFFFYLNFISNFSNGVKKILFSEKTISVHKRSSWLWKKKPLRWITKIHFSLYNNSAQSLHGRRCVMTEKSTSTLQQFSLNVSIHQGRHHNFNSDLATRTGCVLKRTPSNTKWESVWRNFAFNQARDKHLSKVVWWYRRTCAAEEQRHTLVRISLTSYCPHVNTPPTRLEADYWYPAQVSLRNRNFDDCLYWLIGWRTAIICSSNYCLKFLGYVTWLNTNGEKINARKDNSQYGSMRRHSNFNSTIKINTRERSGDTMSIFRLPGELFLRVLKPSGRLLNLNFDIKWRRKEEEKKQNEFAEFIIRS